MQCSGDASQTCGAGWIMTVASNGSASPQILGCYQDSSTLRSSLKQLSPSSVTPVSCLNACVAAGYTYGGAEYASQCFCLNTLPQKLASSQCNMACTADASQTCGGSWTMTVASN
ncbi:WSC domain-containing protein [Chytriomyces sp. MP71]|nr:WSC domain-containing protein [Chytriomyces sp. MP71]